MKIKIPKLKIYGIDVIKNALFFALFIIISLFFIATLISPAIKQFQATKKEYFSNKYSLQQTKITYNIKLEEVNNLIKKDKRILNILKRDFNKKSFSHFASKYMQIVSIEKKDSLIYKKDFLKTTYIIKAYINSPTNFYKFIDNLNNYKYLLKVYFPIEFIKENNKIKLKLKIEHFKFIKELNEI